ncbi:MAG: hypothetical protein Q4E47_02215 [Candidatus Saccharibacteria bacterium]|nr:hypothetical protein [Candidatus Saccharibacteria bacterium]
MANGEMPPSGSTNNEELEQVTAEQDTKIAENDQLREEINRLIEKFGKEKVFEAFTSPIESGMDTATSTQLAEIGIVSDLPAVASENEFLPPAVIEQAGVQAPAVPELPGPVEETSTEVAPFDGGVAEVLDADGNVIETSTWRNIGPTYKPEPADIFYEGESAEVPPTTYKPEPAEAIEATEPLGIEQKPEDDEAGIAETTGENPEEPVKDYSNISESMRAIWKDMASRGYSDEQIEYAISEGMNEPEGDEYAQFLMQVVPDGGPRELNFEDEKPAAKMTLEEFMRARGYTDEQIDDARERGFDEPEGQDFERYLGEVVPLGTPETKAEEPADAEGEPEGTGEEPEGDPSKAGAAETEPEDKEDEEKEKEFEIDPEKMIAGALGVEKEMDSIAARVAIKMFEGERDKKGKLGKLLWGISDTFMHQYRMQKYTTQAKQLIEFKYGKNRDGLTEDQLVDIQAKVDELVPDNVLNVSDAGFARFVKADVYGYEEAMLHEGEMKETYSYVYDENGNKKLVKKTYENGEMKTEDVDTESAQGKAFAQLHSAIESYAVSGDMDDFRENMKDVRRQLEAAGMSEQALSIDNYEKVAENARIYYEHSGDMDKVMAGFAYINGVANRDIRTERHQKGVERVTNALATRGRGLVPAGAIAIGVGVGVMIAKTTTSTVARAIAPGVGGAISASIWAGAAESANVAGEIVDAARLAATGETTGDTKYDERLRQVMYETTSATEYSAKLGNYLDDNGNLREGYKVDELIADLAQVDAAIRMSDSKGIDLISFSSGDIDTIESEREDLDFKRAQLKAALKKSGVDMSGYEAAAMEATAEFQADIDAKDKLRKGLRRSRALKKGAIAGVTSLATAVISQEVMAALPGVGDNRYGVVDSLRGEQLQEGQSTTSIMEASSWIKRVISGPEEPSVTVLGSQFTADQIEQFSNDPTYTVTEAGSRTIPGETITEERQVGLADYIKENGTRFSRHWANNGTQVSDGNELAARISNNGEISMNLGPVSTTQAGEVVDVAGAVNDGRIKIALSLTKEAQGHPIIIDAVPNANGGLSAISDNPMIREMLANGDYSTMEVFIDQGVDSNGVLQAMTLATSVGHGAAADTMFTEAVTTKLPDTVEQLFSVTATVPNEEAAHNMMTLMGIPLVGRKGMTIGKGRVVSGTPAPTPAPTGNGGGEAPAPAPIPTPEEPTGNGGGEAPAPEPAPEPSPEPAPAPSPEPAPAPSPEQPTDTGETGNEPAPIFQPPQVVVPGSTEVATAGAPTEAPVAEIPAIEQNPEADIPQIETAPTPLGLPLHETPEAAPSAEQLSYEDIAEDFNEEAENDASWEKNLESGMFNGNIHLIGGANKHVLERQMRQLYQYRQEGRVSQDDFQRLVAEISTKLRNNRREMIRREADERLRLEMDRRANTGEPAMTEEEQDAYRQARAQEFSEVPATRADVPGTQFSIRPGRRQADGSLKGVPYIDQLLDYYEQDFAERMAEAERRARREAAEAAAAAQGEAQTA